MARWEAFFAAQLAAAATLAGLLFVGVSLNLTKILDNPSLPGRSLSGFYLLLANLIVASLMLVPDQPSTASGLEILVIGLALWGMVSRLDVGAIRRSRIPAVFRAPFLHVPAGGDSVSGGWRIGTGGCARRAVLACGRHGDFIVRGLHGGVGSVGRDQPVIGLMRVS